MSVTKSTETSRTSTNGHVAKRLAAYTAAATGAALAASAADAAVVVVTIPTVTKNTLFTINLSAAGSGGAWTFKSLFTSASAHAFRGRVDFGNAGDPNGAVALTAVGYGVFIGGGTGPAGWTGATGAWADPAWNGQPSPLYVGFRLQVSSGNYRFGWIEFVHSSGNISTVSRWAYESQLNTAIAAGVTPAAVPGGAGLMALAVGAAGVRGRRRARN